MYIQYLVIVCCYQGNYADGLLWWTIWIIFNQNYHDNVLNWQWWTGDKGNILEIAAICSSDME